MPESPQPTFRKPLGILAMLLALGLYLMAVVMLFEALSPMPLWLELIGFCIAGTVWILPLKPYMRWMETGRWRA